MDWSRHQRIGNVFLGPRICDGFHFTRITSQYRRSELEDRYLQWCYDRPLESR